MKNRIESFDDDSSLFTRDEEKVLTIKGSKRNLKITDSPKFSYRGMLLDISRNFYGPKKIKQILDYLSFFKINHLDFRLTDDEGWRLEIPGLEELTEVGSKRGYTKDESDNLIPIYGSGPDSNSSPGSGYLSKSEFKDILKYANERNKN